MITCQLTHNPYLLTTDVMFNGHEPKVNSAVEKFEGRPLVDWAKRYDKYFEGDRVDKIECPKNFYEEAKAAIPARLEDLQEQLEHTLADGKTDAINMIQRKIEKLTKLDDMIEKSVITKQEAIDARLKPRMATSKLVADGVLPESTNEGLHGAAFTSGLTFVSSAVIHGREFFEGVISAQELASAVALETGAAGAIDGVSDFVSTAVGTAMRGSSHELIQSVGGSVLPAVAVSFAVESYDSISDYAQGLIDGNELAYELGENAATIGGGALAGAKIGAVAGTFAGPVGSVVGGIAGGLVGSMVASEAYLTAAEVAPGACQEIAEGIEGFTSSTMEAIGREFPDSVDSARASFNDFFESNNIPVRA